MKTWFPDKKNPIDCNWLYIDASGQILGRMASEIAVLLRGRHKPQYTPHHLSGDAVVVVNCSEIVVTGRKLDDKIYHRHTGYPGGLRSANLRDALNKDAAEVVRLAVKRMLPKTPLGRRQLGNLYAYSGSEHPHAAQQPVPYVRPPLKNLVTSG